MGNENRIDDKHYQEIVKIIKNSKQITTNEIIEPKEFRIEKIEKDESKLKKYAITGAIIGALLWGSYSLDLIGFLEDGLNRELDYNKEVSKPYIENIIENKDNKQLEKDIQEYYEDENEEENKSLKGGI